MGGFEDFEPIFVEPKSTWAKTPGSVPSRRFLMHAFAPDYYHLTIHVTDFHTNTFEAVKSISQLEDMRDMVGIGGSWSEFVDYLIASIKSEEVKLVLEKSSGSIGDATTAKVVGQKSKGMPLISISLIKLSDSSASDAIEKMSFGLFNALKCKQVEPNSFSELSKAISKEKRQKLEEMKSSDKADASSNGSSEDFSGKQGARETQSKKVNNRIMPAHRRAKVRGALLHDSDDE